MKFTTAHSILRLAVLSVTLGIFSISHGLQLSAAGLFDSEKHNGKNAAKIGILCGQLIDGRSETPIKNAAILIEGEKISAVGAREIIPREALTVDLGNATVLPGFIDGHSHPLISTDTYQTDHLKWSSAYKALRGLKAVQDNLMAGWTTLRIAGDADLFYALFDIRRAIDEKLFR